MRFPKKYVVSYCLKEAVEEIGSKALVGGGIGLGVGLGIQLIASPICALSSSYWKEQPHQLEEFKFADCGNTY